MAKRNRESIYRVSLTGVMIALIFIMAFTPIGYLKIGPVSITFITIPVAIGAITGGPVVGLILGTAFGVTSLIQAFTVDPLGTALLEHNPFFTVLLCIVPRAITGLLCGLVFNAFRSKSYTKIGATITSFSSGFLNTVLFIAFLLLLFYNTPTVQSIGTSVLAVVIALVTTNAVIEWVACTIIGSAASIAVVKSLKNKF